MAQPVNHASTVLHVSTIFAGLLLFLFAMAIAVLFYLRYMKDQAAVEVELEEVVEEEEETERKHLELDQYLISVVDIEENNDSKGVIHQIDSSIQCDFEGGYSLAPTPEDDD